MAETRYQFVVISLTGGVFESVQGFNDETAARAELVKLGRASRSPEDDEVYCIDLAEANSWEWYKVEEDPGHPQFAELMGVPELRLHEIERETYGGDERAINLHSDRTYVDQYACYWRLSRTLDGAPPFFEAYGPWGEEYSGVLPRLCVKGTEYWGAALSWSQAVEAFFAAAEEAAQAQEIKRLAAEDAAKAKAAA